MSSPVIEQTDDAATSDSTSEPVGLSGGSALSLMGFVVAFHVVLLVAVSIFAFANRGDGGDDGVDAIEAVEIAAETRVVALEFSFEVDEHPAGSPIEMTLDNQGAIFHNLLIEGIAGFTLEADPAAEDVGVVDLAPGTWVMYCSVPGHREAGMEADLIVGG